MDEVVSIVRRERANSYEFGKAGNRLKIYFEDVEDLKAQVKAYKDFLNEQYNE